MRSSRAAQRGQHGLLAFQRGGALGQHGLGRALFLLLLADFLLFATQVVVKRRQLLRLLFQLSAGAL